MISEDGIEETSIPDEEATPPDIQKKCETIMSPAVLKIDEDKSVFEAASLLAREKKTSVIAVKEGKITGIASERDFLSRLVAEGKSPEKTKIKDIITPSLVTVSTETSIAEVGRLMREHRCRRLPVTRGGEIVGIITQDDLVNALSGIWRKVESIMSKKAASVRPDQELTSAAKKMRDESIGQVIVTEEDTVVGILTETDFISKVLAKKRNPKQLKVKDVMSSPVVSVEPEFPIFKASQLMRERRIRRLPVISKGRLMGILTQDDIANAIKSVVLQIQPVSEKRAKGKAQHSLKQGYSYLILEEELSRSGEIFVDLVIHGAHGLGITRKHPDKIRDKYNLEKTPLIWLSKERGYESHIDPTDIVGLGFTIKEFIRKSNDGVVLFSGVEYLMTQNSYSEVIKFIQSINEAISQSKTRFIISLDPKTMSEQELHLIEREVDKVESVIASF
ncbi:CBS domain-containing protein [Candidatus Altiarchaeota archaeon]